MSIGVGIIGLGTVGSGTVEILEERIPLFAKQLGIDLRIAMLCAKEEAEIAPYRARGFQTTLNADELIQNPEVQIVVELVGGYDLPRKWITAALQTGKHVVTANKAMIAKHGVELFPLASEKNLYLLFEAAVGGGIPVIRAMQESLVGGEMQSVRTIINGTCNFILTKMFQEGEEFSTVLAEAQRLGYAEADPSFDIDGIDSAHKTAILATLSAGQFVDFNKIHISGIRSIEQIDIKMAKEMNCSIKLLGIFRRAGDRVDVRVHPALLPNDHLLSSVNGVLNAVYLDATNIGPTLMTGAGAGKLPTASAVVADIVSIARGITSGRVQPPPLSFFSKKNEAVLMPIDELKSRYYIRLTMSDRTGVLAAITQLFKQHSISVKTMRQNPLNDDKATIIFTTHECCEVDLQKAIAQIDQLRESLSPARVIRFEE